MKIFVCSRVYIAFVIIICLLFAPLTAYAKKGEKNYNQGLKYEQELKWELAAQEFALALAANPSDTEYILHFQRAMFNASQMFMQRARALEEKQDYAGAYNALRQAYSYDPVNELALSEIARVVRLRQDKANGSLKEDKTKGDGKVYDTGQVPTLAPTVYKENHGPSTAQDYENSATEQKRVIKYEAGTDLESVITSLADELGLNVIFDNITFRSPRTTKLSLKDVTVAQALDLLLIKENLFFQKLKRRTIIIADQTRRPFYQQLVIRTFYLSNAKPEDVRTMLYNIIPAQAGRMQTIIVTDKETNSVTIRDTAENVRLIGSLIQNIDKDRPEVVMDVKIYEVSKDTLLQLGNNFGRNIEGGANTLQNIGGISGGGLINNNRVPFASALAAAGGAATGIGLLIPTSTLSALQKKNNGRLLVSTQVHAFSNEESQTRVGERVPVQTATVFPRQGNNNSNDGSGDGVPVINYEPVGLTLKFTPVVFPDKDVQVKMSIESKGVRNANTFTPTFVERSITGTARIQNNRTMLLASINQDRASNSMAGLPLLGLIPILGRIFSTPTQDNAKTDIVIAVTPHVLRAPNITPQDEGEYESGTLQNPTLNKIEEMIRQEDVEEQIAMSNRPQNSLQSISNADTNQMSNSIVDQMVESVQANRISETGKPKTELTAMVTNHMNNEASVATVNIGLELLSQKAYPNSNKRHIALLVDAQDPVGAGSVKLLFDPKVVAIRKITSGNFFNADKSLNIVQHNNSDGVTLTVTPPVGFFIKGKGALLNLEVETLQKGESSLGFDTRISRFIAIDGHDVSVRFLQDNLGLKNERK